ncbi:class I SAM-dependent methyltransferase [Rothia sp. P7208]|uniref:class I SAM-dependent methyltransferase n=1 Tax=Rothia sp. P7208 TaxID=3402660 RepID=UPI003AD15686
MVAEHYFSATPNSDFSPREIDVTLTNQRVRVQSASGIFSPSGIDKGTAILLENVPEPEGTSFLDIGTGWGPITLTLALKNPQAQVTGVEVNERSAHLTRTNAQKLGLTNVTVYAPEEVPQDLRFDTIWSNPPIRVGKDVLHNILRTWIPRLNVGGCAYLVVQKNLGADSLQKWLAHELEEQPQGTFQVSRYSTSKGFRILEVVRNA